MKNLLAQADRTIEFAPQDTSKFGNLTQITIPGMIKAGLQFILVAAAVIFFFILVIGGIKWIMSGGDKAHTEAARNQITAALVGLVIVFAAWAIASLVGTFFGVESIFTSVTIPVIGQ